MDLSFDIGKEEMYQQKVASYPICNPKDQSCLENAPDNRFDKYAVSPDIVTFTDQDYTMHLQDQNWTKEETEYLFSLCREFDARFVVIADRYDFPSKHRSLEVVLLAGPRH